jgi:hypothetical protein
VQVLSARGELEINLIREVTCPHEWNQFLSPG